MKKLLSIEVFEDENGAIRSVQSSDEILVASPGLDARVSAVAQAALAAVSSSFAAELETTTHFLENLERMTAEITGKLSISDVSGDELKLPE